MSLFVGRGVGNARAQSYRFTEFQAQIKSELLNLGYEIIGVPCLKSFCQSIFEEE